MCLEDSPPVPPSASWWSSSGSLLRCQSWVSLIMHISRSYIININECFDVFPICFSSAYLAFKVWLSDWFSFRVSAGFSSPPWEQLCNFSPAVSQFLMCLVDDPVLLLGPGCLLHLWVQVVVPAFAALLADTTL